LYALQNIVRMIRVQEYEMGGTLNKHRRERRTLKILVGKPEERKPLGENLGAHGKITLECILGKLGGSLWTRCIYHTIGSTGGLL